MADDYQTHDGIVIPPGVLAIAEQIAADAGCGATVSEGDSPERTVLCCDPHLTIDAYAPADCECLKQALAKIADMGSATAPIGLGQEEVKP